MDTMKAIHLDLDPENIVSALRRLKVVNPLLPPNRRGSGIFIRLWFRRANRVTKPAFFIVLEIW